MNFWQHQAFPRRLPATPAALQRMAWGPSWRAPTVAEVTTTFAFSESAAVTNLADLLQRWSAEDLIWEAGQLVGLSLSGRAFLAGGTALLAAAPIRAVRLVAVQPFVGELAASPLLSWLTRLDLRGNRIGMTGLETLCQSRHLAALEELALERNNLDSSAVTLIEQATFPRLRTVSVSVNEVCRDRSEALQSRLTWLFR